MDSSGTSNCLHIDYTGNPDLKDLFGGKDIGDKVTLKLKLQVMSKTPDGIKLAIDKVIADGVENAAGEEAEAEPSETEPIMMRMSRRGKMGPHNRPPQTAENASEPGMKAYV